MTSLLPRDLDALAPDAFVALLGGAVEHSPWVAQRAWGRRPFADLRALTAAMADAIRQASPGEQLALLRAHPELAGHEAASGTMTEASTGEQGRLGLTAQPPGAAARLQVLNCAYRERFGFPLIVALRLHTSLDSVIGEAQRRLHHDPAHEWDIALGQVVEVMRGRLLARFADTPPGSCPNSPPPVLANPA